MPSAKHDDLIDVVRFDTPYLLAKRGYCVGDPDPNKSYTVTPGDGGFYPAVSADRRRQRADAYFIYAQGTVCVEVGQAKQGKWSTPWIQVDFGGSVGLFNATWHPFEVALTETIREAVSSFLATGRMICESLPSE